MASGDPDGNDFVNVVDIVLVVGYITGNASLTPEQFCAADMNGDEQINVVDIVAIVGIIISF